MRGDKPALKDLASVLKPEVVDLYCYEDLLEIEEKKVELEQVYPSFLACEIHSFYLRCGSCCADIYFTCRAERAALRSFQALCFDSVRFLCYDCAVRLTSR